MQRRAVRVGAPSLYRKPPCSMSASWRSLCVPPHRRDILLITEVLQRSFPCRTDQKPRPAARARPMHVNANHRLISAILCVAEPSAYARIGLLASKLGSRYGQAETEAYTSSAVGARRPDLLFRVRLWRKPHEYSHT